MSTSILIIIKVLWIVIIISSYRLSTISITMYRYHSQLPISSSMTIHFHGPLDSHHHQSLQVINNQYYLVSSSLSTTTITIYDHTLSKVNINTYYYYGGCVSTCNNSYLYLVLWIVIVISIYRLSTISVIMYLYHSQLTRSSYMKIHFHRSTSILIITTGDVFLCATA